MSRIPPDSPEADVQEQTQDWAGDEEEKQDRSSEIPLDAPEADVLEQQRSADLEEEDRTEG